VTAAGERPDPVPEAPVTPPVTGLTPSDAANTVAPRGPAPAPVGTTPAALLLPDLDASAVVVPVGADANGQVEVPADGSTVGWYRYGPAPDDRSGSVVLVGHRDTRADGRGVLYSLERSEVGDVLEVVTDDWAVTTYRVVARESFTKDSLPAAELFRRTGTPVLTVITCGGTYTPGVGYSDNVVVTAVPDGPPRART
jgi:hypothetical protein